MKNKKLIQQFCKEHGIAEAQFYGKEEIKVSLYPPSVTSIPEGFNPTVGGGLYLGSVTSIPEGFNPTVGGSLDLDSVTSIPEGFNPTVGGSLDLRSVTSIPEGFNRNNLPKPQYPLIWNGCILADGILKKLVHQRGNNFKLRDLVGTDESYLVSDGNGTFAHGETLKKAKEDLRYKLAAEKLKKEPIRPDTIVTVQHYRIITGACEAGCRDWMKRNGITKDRMRADELLPLLQKSNAYGYESFKRLMTA